MKQSIILFLALLLSACVAQPTLEPSATTSAPLVLRSEENPYAPQAGDLDKQQAGVILTSLDLLERTDLDPVRTELSILGSMPNVCNELRVKVNPPDDSYNVYIEIYSLIDPKENCDNVFQQFKAQITLGIYSQGRYSLWVNKIYIGDFTSY